jgi:glycosyltransferase involved in cell wall biosynthesis
MAARENPSQLLSIVVPAHNEARGIARALDILIEAVGTSGMEIEVIVVDDGSHDGTFDHVTARSLRDARVKGLRFTRNFGKEAAILAGLTMARGHAVVTIDADLQHPPELVPQMVEAWRTGAMVVDGVKRGRESDGAFTRWRAGLFNALLSRLGGINLENASDFKLLDRAVVDALTNKLPERQRFYRGLADWVGYPHASVPFDVAKRHEGEGKWSIWNLIKLATTAIVSFTSAPLQIVTVLGVLTLALGFVVGADALISWFRGQAVSGFATTIITLLIVGSFIMISLGIIGEYIAKIYDEIKARPSYLVESTVGFEDRGSATVRAEGFLTHAVTAGNVDGDRKSRASGSTAS